MRTIVAVYDELAMARHVVEDLVKAGVSRDKISLVANDATGKYGTYLGQTPLPTDDAVGPGEGASFGAVVGGLTGVLVGLGALAIPGIGPVLAAGPLLAALGGGAVGVVAGAATGGIVAGLVKTGVPEDAAHYYAEGVRRGGTLITVRAEDNMATQVQEILNRHNPIDIDERAANWQQAGWTTFNESAQPYDPEAINRDSKAYREALSEKSAARTTASGARVYDNDKTARV